MTETRKLRVFLCHSSQDKPIVRDLYQRLNAEGWIDPWLDEEKLLPGQVWDMEIKKAVKSADAIIAFLSDSSVKKEGYIQKELKFALDVALEKPEDTIFIIPLRLDDCFIPRSLRSIHYIDFFPEAQKTQAYIRLLDSLKLRAKIFSSGADQQELGNISLSNKNFPFIRKKSELTQMAASTTSYLQPRGFWGSFIAIASGTGLAWTLAFTWILSAFMKMNFDQALFIGNISGGLFGIAMGLSMAYFIKAAKLSVVFNDKRNFHSKLNMILAEIGYHPESQTDRLFTYKPSIHTGLLFGKVSVQVEDDSADILGPWYYVDMIEKRLFA